jgi:hypothetical protein
VAERQWSRRRKAWYNPNYSFNHGRQRGQAMPTKGNSRVLRQRAEEVVQMLAEEGAIPESEQADLATSLVRQWITYDGNAALFLGDRQIYVMLGSTPLGTPVPVPEVARLGWIKQLTRDWKINPDNLSDVLGQLNRGQSAEVTSEDGIPLRLWVNPKERSRGVEPLVKRPIPAGTKRDYLKIAASELEHQFGEGLPPDEMDALARSVAKQWQKYGGHACLFIDGEQQVFFKLTEEIDGGCQVTTQRLAVSLEPLLTSLGFSPEMIPEVVARINLGQEVELRDKQGVPSVLWHDPKARRVLVKPLESTRSSSPPIFCPRCNAVLAPWKAGEREQTCRHCGQVVSLP